MDDILAIKPQSPESSWGLSVAADGCQSAQIVFKRAAFEDLIFKSRLIFLD